MRLSPFVARRITSDMSINQAGSTPVIIHQVDVELSLSLRQLRPIDPCNTLQKMKRRSKWTYLLALVQVLLDPHKAAAADELTVQ